MCLLLLLTRLDVGAQSHSSRIEAVGEGTRGGRGADPPHPRRLAVRRRNPSACFCSFAFVLVAMLLTHHMPLGLRPCEDECTRDR